MEPAVDTQQLIISIRPASDMHKYLLPLTRVAFIIFGNLDFKYGSWLFGVQWRLMAFWQHVRITSIVCDALLDLFPFSFSFWLSLPGGSSTYWCTVVQSR